MATLDWSQCAVVESIPGKVSGAWVLKGQANAGIRYFRKPVSIAFAEGWDTLKNGELLAAAELAVVEAIGAAVSGSYLEIEIPAT